MSKETKVVGHTPGPWYTSPQQGYVRYEGVHGPNICGMDEFGGPAEEAFANARLIAAAPEMLQALEACESLIEFYAHREMNAPANGEDAVRETRENLQLYRNALKKARGAGDGRQGESRGGNANV